MENSTKNKQYIFNFIGGGWNTVWAKSLPKAKRAVRLEYTGDISVPNMKTVRIATEHMLADCLSQWD